MKQTINQSQTNTREKKKENFFKKHWKKMVATTVVICGVTVSVILLNKNSNRFIKLFLHNDNKAKTSSTQIKMTDITTALDKVEPTEIIEKNTEKIIEVGSYIRRLPKGQKISKPKKEQMLSLNVYIDDNHTYCNEYARKIKSTVA